MYIVYAYMEKAHVAATPPVVHFVVCVAAPNFWAFLHSFVRRRPNFDRKLHFFKTYHPLLKLTICAKIYYSFLIKQWRGIFFVIAI